MLTKHSDAADWYAIDFSQFELDLGETATSHEVTVTEHEVSRRGGNIDQSAAFIDQSQLQWPEIRYKLKPATPEDPGPPVVPATQLPGLYRVKGTVTTSANRTFAASAILNVTSEGVTVA